MTSLAVASVVEIALIHGVRVMPKIDVPGHSQSWCVGYPSICLSNIFGNRLEPLKLFGMLGGARRCDDFSAGLTPTVPLSSEVGTNMAVGARFWPWLVPLSRWKS